MPGASGALTRGAHPYGVQPLGNLISHDAAQEARSTRETSLGALAVLPDAILLDVLGHLDAASLGRASRVSRFFYVLSHHDELWRTLVLADSERLSFVRTWKETYIAQHFPRALVEHRPLRMAGVFSDTLFQPWLCASLGVQERWLTRNTIPRRSAATLTVEQFRREFEIPNRPVIITDLVTQWPAYRRWSREALEGRFGDVDVHAGGFTMTLRDYFQYSDEVRDELPLYLFDKEFASKMPELADEYSVPEYFSDDLFTLLGDKRPDFRWLIIGPERSGSSFHVDPNATCAWNACVVGSKKWVLFPPGMCPPGVIASADGATVQTPVSLMEWFVNFYDHLDEYDGVENGPVEGTHRAGEVLFVPRGWWHTALNLELSVAITQNYAPPSGVRRVLDFLRRPNRAELVSGVEDSERDSLGDQLESAILRSRPEVLESASQSRNGKGSLAVSWNTLSSTENGGFSLSSLFGNNGNTSE